VKIRSTPKPGGTSNTPRADFEATADSAKTSPHGATPIVPWVRTGSDSFDSRPGAARHEPSETTYFVSPEGITSASFSASPAWGPSLATSTASSFGPGLIRAWMSISTGSDQTSLDATRWPLT